MVVDNSASWAPGLVNTKTVFNPVQFLGEQWNEDVVDVVLLEKG